MIDDRLDVSRVSVFSQPKNEKLTEKKFFLLIFPSTSELEYLYGEGITAKKTHSLLV